MVGEVDTLRRMVTGAGNQEVMGSRRHLRLGLAKKRRELAVRNGERDGAFHRNRCAPSPLHPQLSEVLPGARREPKRDGILDLFFAPLASHVMRRP